MYPVMLDLKDRRVLVVGGGGVALRKVQGLIEDEALVTVVAVAAVDNLSDLAGQGRITLECRSYRDGEAASFVLVFAATDDRSVNRRIFEDARAAGIWANVADDPELCSFHLPARVRRGPLQLAIASEGQAPFVVRRLRQLFDRRLGSEWAEWVPAAVRFRRSVRRADLSRPEQESRYDRFFEGTVDAQNLTARVPSAEEEATWLEAAAEDHCQPLRTVSTGSAKDDSGQGHVSLVGAGPGCSGLLTVLGRKRLSEADAVVYDRLAAAALPCELDAKVELHPVGKIAGNHPIPQDEINALLVRLAREGRRVVRLKGGDPFVFGRGSEEAEVLETEGIPFDVVPGVTSGVAAAAWMGVPVTHRREAVRLTLLTAHEAVKSDGPQVRWDLLAMDPHATLVGYMGVKAMPVVSEKLIAAGMDPQTPAAMVEQGTTSAQRHVVSTLEDLPQAVADSAIKPPALFIIGPTVGHQRRLDWYGRLPLAGQRLVVVATLRDLVCALERGGADVVAVPIPLTPAARVVLSALPLTGCVVLSGAEVDALHEELDGPGWSSDARRWCIGEEAGRRAGERGWRMVHVLEGSTDGAAVAEWVAGQLGKG
uniref:Siroheme synthase n=1 Tax=uncultured sulfate-reducing bacterium TaxID=153939 RepID=Q3IBQ3_9BACT|nr:Siroheme synthase [uncultured sulfate-reducing bacterium]